MYQYNIILTINKPTLEGKNSVAVIDHIIAYCIVDCQFKKAILRTDLTDHFSIAKVLIAEELIHLSQKVQSVHKPNQDEKITESFKQRL